MSIRKLGGLLAIAYCLAGVFLIFLGWNGTASYDNTSAQMPYVVSGGLGGLALVMIGVGLMIVQAQRADRAEMQATFAELRDTLLRVGLSGAAAGGAGSAPAAASASASGSATVLAGPTNYHRPSCTLIGGQRDLAEMTLDAAEENGLEPCRICNPAAA
jgi:hypothetical protein